MDILFVLIVCKNEAEIVVIAKRNDWISHFLVVYALSDNNNVTIGILLPCVLFINASKQTTLHANAQQSAV